MNKPLFALDVSLWVFAIFLLWSVTTVAHPGGIDGEYGHTDRATGEYHFHRGIFEGMTFPNALSAAAFVAYEWSPDVVVIEAFVISDTVEIDRGPYRCEVVRQVNDDGLKLIRKVNYCWARTIKDDMRSALPKMEIDPNGAQRFRENISK